jgi:hypothetical protein
MQFKQEVETNTIRHQKVGEALAGRSQDFKQMLAVGGAVGGALGVGMLALGKQAAAHAKEVEQLRQMQNDAHKYDLAAKLADGTLTQQKYNQELQALKMGYSRDQIMNGANGKPVGEPTLIESMQKFKTAQDQAVKTGRPMDVRSFATLLNAIDRAVNAGDRSLGLGIRVYDRFRQSGIDKAVGAAAAAGGIP